MKRKIIIIIFIALLCSTVARGQAKKDFHNLKINYRGVLKDTTITEKKEITDFNFDSLKTVSFEKALEIAIKKDSFFYKHLFRIDLNYYQWTGESYWYFFAEEIIPRKPNLWNRNPYFKIKSRYISINGKGKITWYAKGHRKAICVLF